MGQKVSGAAARLLRGLRALVSDEGGATAVEFSVILTSFTVLVAATLVLIDPELNAAFNAAMHQLHVGTGPR